MAEMARLCGPKENTGNIVVDEKKEKLENIVQAVKVTTIDFEKHDQEEQVDPKRFWL